MTEGCILEANAYEARPIADRRGSFQAGLYGRVAQVWPMAAFFDPVETPRLPCPRLIGRLSFSSLGSIIS